MSKKANPTAIGLFVLIGVVLLVGGLFLFTSSQLFTRTEKCIVYFDSTLSGLEEGAPVKYRGVTIGSVSRVMIQYNQATNDHAMPVIIELRQDLIEERIVGSTAFHSLQDTKQAIRRGVRAKLETDSFVTGVLYVELETEESPPPAVYHQLVAKYIEIPSLPTEIQKLMMNLAKIDLPDLQQKIGSLAEHADKLLAGINIVAINAGLTNLLVSANRVVSAPDLTNAFTSLKVTLEQYRLLGANANTNSLVQLNSALEQVRGAMANLRDTLSADSALRIQLSATLDQFDDAAQSVSSLADYLHNHPNGLLVGREPIAKKLK
jgi:paraquat-inducible protein B